ncbi:hypothetical protein DDB_G0278287 [Dictyostelium discoideum AX4]|uniref:Uncharacterized protein n=1 Tax=Dictyostelium discoideum TaxID=44689 RepID=Q54YD7_DICDI|nr:hypothetical protein DDB_G0278287 [Dictyostelium discoideum AX4]EAL68316.1 hypothetical protein DDB_G0278287 [Dictyostelium discoideum AX4]|eukprot:XP_642265.1 hypothetical protein DDB_G0278287 [Dictyostelium discoideum AX4]
MVKIVTRRAIQLSKRTRVQMFDLKQVLTQKVKKSLPMFSKSKRILSKGKYSTKTSTKISK